MKMEGLKKMQDDLEKVIEKDDSSTVTTDSDDTVKHSTMSFRERLGHLIHSQKFMVAVMILVVLDCLMVIVELLFDLEIVELGEEHEYVPHIFHYMSLSILFLFLIEISLRFYVLRLVFFLHKLEVFDAVVVIVSFVLDIVFRNNEDAVTGIGLLVVLRLWRIGRIVNGIVISVKKQAEKKIDKERHLRDLCEQELAKYRKYCSEQESEIEALQNLLKENDIDFTTKQIHKPHRMTKVDVMAEVNLSMDEEDGNVIEKAVVEL